MPNDFDTSQYPLGSTHPYVLYNNAGNEDLFVNDVVNETFVDRPPFNRARSTLYGMQQEFLRALAKMGYETTYLTYADGVALQVDRPTQLIERDGSVYAVKLPASFPVELTGTWAIDEGALVDVGDQGLRTALAAPGGADLSGLQRFPTSQVSTVQKVLQRNAPANVFDYMTEAEIADVLTLSPVLDHTTAFQQALNNNVVVEVPPFAFNISAMTRNKFGHTIICHTASGSQAYGGGAVFRGTNSATAIDTVTKPTSYTSGIVYVGMSDDIEKGSDTTQIGIRFVGDSQKDIDAKVDKCGFLYLNTDVEMNGTNIEFDSTIFSNSTFGFATSLDGLPTAWENRGITFSDTCRFHSMGKVGTETAAVRLDPTHNIRDVSIKGLFDDCVTAVTGFASGMKMDLQIVRARGTGADIDATGHGHPAYIRTANLSLDYYANAATNAAMANSGLITKGLMRLTLDNVTVHGSGGHGVDQQVSGAVMRGVHASDAGQFADNQYDGVNISGAGCFLNGVSASQDAQGTTLTNKARYAINLLGNSTYVGSITPGLNTRSGPLGMGAAITVYGSLPSFTGPNPSVTYGAAPPTTGTYRQGSIRWNTGAAAGGFAGWSCVTTGTPGTWKTFGVISA